MRYVNPKVLQFISKPLKITLRKQPKGLKPKFYIAVIIN